MVYAHLQYSTCISTGIFYTYINYDIYLYCTIWMHIHTVLYSV